MHLQIASYEAQVHQSLSNKINVKWKKLKSLVTRRILYFELGIFSFKSYIYYLTRGFIATARAFNLLTRALNLLTHVFNLSTRAFNRATRGFDLVTHGFELVTRGFDLVTRGFELVTRGFELITQGFELVTRRFELVTHINELVTRILLFHIKSGNKSYFKMSLTSIFKGKQSNDFNAPSTILLPCVYISLYFYGFTIVYPSVVIDQFNSVNY